MTASTVTPRLVARQALVPIIVAGISIVAVAALIEMLALPLDGLIPQGPAAVATHLEEDLAAFFDPQRMALAQRVLHVGGALVFLGLAASLTWRKGASGLAGLAAVTLASLGAALFAPIGLLPGGVALSRLIGSVTVEELPGFWGSIAGLTTLAFLIVFPDGQWRPAWTKPMVALAAITGLAAWIGPSGLLDPHTWPGWVQVAWLIALPGLAVTAGVIRSRQGPLDPASRPVVASLSAALAAFLLLWLLQPELTPDALDLVLVTPRLQAVFAVNVLLLLTVAVFLFPVSVSFAIVKHRLFDLDYLINRTLVYGTVTALVGLTFLAVALGVATVARVELSAAIDEWASGPVGVALGTVVVLTFQPLRGRVQRAVDRRFYRQRYDAGRIIEAFAGDASRLVDPEELERELVSVVDRALRPKSVWLHSADEASELLEAGPGAKTVDLTDPSALADPHRLHAADAALLVPLVAGGSLTGVLELGPRSSASRYSSLDLELLDRLARTAGPALKLSHEVRAREQEVQLLERNAHELELARKIQQGLLPHDLPEVGGWRFAAWYRPAREVGGDFYDWMQLADGRLVLVIGDVSDKGIPAALVMATCRTLIRVAAGEGKPPGQVLAEVNERLQPDIPSGMFVTCLIAVLDPIDGSMVLANAGHNLPFHRSGPATEEIMVRGMPLGLMPGMAYEQVEARVMPGDSLVLTSDGLAESHDPTGEMYGTSRLQAALGHSNGDPVAAALSDHREFVGDSWQQEDDITMFTLVRAEADAEPAAS